MRAAALFFFVSLSFLCVASQARDLLWKVEATKTGKEFSQVVLEAPEDVWTDEFLYDARELATDGSDWKKAKVQMVAALRLTTAFEPQSNPHKTKTPASNAKKILSDPRFRDPGAAKSRNWMSRSFERIGDAFAEFLRKLNFDPAPTALPSVTGGAKPLEVIVFSVLGVGLAIFLIFFIVKFRLVYQAKNRTLGILSDDEPDLTADEWLVRAAQLESDGRFRDAVRCLYLASLIRLDEARLLNFIRTDTNWEHLLRFESNKLRSSEVELRTATKEFDRVWYGQRDKGSLDVTWFREFYRTVLSVVARSQK